MAPPTFKDPKFWTAEEKKTQKIDRLARSLFIQGFPNDISLTDSNDIAKDLLDALERQMRGSEYGEQDRKAAILYEYETFKATKGEQLLDTYLRYLQVINDLKKCGYKKDNYYALLAKGFNRKKFYAKPTNNNLRTSSASYSANKKPEYGLEVMRIRVDEKGTGYEQMLSCFNCKKKDILPKTARKQSDSDKEINANIGLHAKMENVLSDQRKVISQRRTLSENQVNTFEEKNNEFNEQIKVLNETNVDLLAQTEVLQEQLKVKHVVIDTHTECQAQYAKLEEERYQYMISISALCDNDKQHRKKIDEQEILFDKMSRQLVEMNNNVLRLQEKILEKETKILELEECVRNKDLEIEKCLERLNDCENKLHKIGQTTKRFETSLYDERVFGSGYIRSFFTHSIEALEIRNLKEQERIKWSVHYDYGNLNGKLDTVSSVRRPKHSGVIWKKKGSSNTSNVDLSSVSNSKLNKDVKRYSRKDLLSCNNSHHEDTRDAYACNDAMNVSCNSRLYASYDVNDLFVFNDVCIRNSQVSKMPFKKKPHDSLNVHSRSNSNKSLPRTVFSGLPKMEPLAEPV
ncbi:hypothetical protein Tco_0185328 [Tanacetum coccineum]